MTSYLLQLLRVYKQYTRDPISLLKHHTHANRLLDLVDLLLQNGNMLEEEAAKALGFTSASSAGFRSICYRLRDVLLDGLLTLPYKKHVSPLRYEILKSQKLFLQGMVLQHNGKTKLGVLVLERALHHALKYEQYDVAQLALPYITKFYAFKQPDEKKWKKYQSLQRKISIEMEGLLLSNERYNLISHYGLYKSKSHADELDSHLTHVMKDFQKEEGKYSSYLYINRRAEIEHFYLLRNREYQACIDRTDVALNLLEPRPFFNRTTRHHLTSAKVDALLNLGRQKEGLAELLLLYDEVDEGTHNWYKLQRQVAMTYALMKDFNALHDLTVEMTARRDIRKLKSTYELWRIIEAYVVFLVKAGKVKRPESRYHSSYRLGKFLNEVPAFSKDKQGLNTAILIAQILYYLVIGRMDKIDNRIESLNKYCYRYLRKDETYRTNCFIKMISRLPDAEYHPKRTKRYVKKYYKLLKADNRIINTDVFDSEIIPYENLWEVVTEVLPIKGYKKRTTSSAQ